MWKEFNINKNWLYLHSTVDCKWMNDNVNIANILWSSIYCIKPLGLSYNTIQKSLKQNYWWQNMCTYITYILYWSLSATCLWKLVWWLSDSYHTSTQLVDRTRSEDISQIMYISVFHLRDLPAIFLKDVVTWDGSIFIYHDLDFLITVATLSFNDLTLSLSLRSTSCNCFCWSSNAVSRLPFCSLLCCTSSTEKKKRNARQSNYFKIKCCASRAWYVCPTLSIKSLKSSFCNSWTSNLKLVNIKREFAS